MRSSFSSTEHSYLIGSVGKKVPKQQRDLEVVRIVTAHVARVPFTTNHGYPSHPRPPQPGYYQPTPQEFHHQDLLYPQQQSRNVHYYHNSNQDGGQLLPVDDHDSPEDVRTSFEREMSTKGCLIPLPEIHRFITESMTSVGTPKAHAVMMAEVLTMADYRGHFSHGLNRLEMYVKDVKSKSTDAHATPAVVSEKASVALVDGRNGLGPVVGNFCMDLAMKKAGETGVGWVSARGSNHYGIAGWYSMRAMAKGFVGLSFTNSSPLLSPTRSKAAALGTNPITLAAPGQGDSFVLDMATTTVAVGKIELQQRKREPLPMGWAQNKEGQITTDPDDAMEASCLMPLGGAEETSGYKGTGLALLVEIFCGILSGSKYGPFVRNWKNTTEEANLGQCFIALDHSAFAPGFEGRLTHLLSTIRAMEPADPEKEVIVPGDPEKWHMKCVDEEGGITYHRNQIDSMVQLAEELKIAPMKAVN